MCLSKVRLYPLSLGRLIHKKISITISESLNISTIKYSKVRDLQLDMPPVIGSLNVKDIMIEQNDNATQTKEFFFFGKTGHW